MKLNAKQIQEKALEILKAEKNGIRWSPLLRRIGKDAPGTPANSIQGAVHGLLSSNTDSIKKVSRGTYRLAEYVDSDSGLINDAEAASPNDAKQVADSGNGKLSEQDFYSSFAQWLIGMNEATFAAALGGNVLGGKWGTPDVIGVLRPLRGAIFEFEPQITSAEIKVTTKEPLVAFGQAVAYRLFSHRSYVVIPETTSSEDIDRLNSLCIIHGVGLVTFKLKMDYPDYMIVVPPQSAAPDVFYVNQMLDRLKSQNPDLLQKLFP